MLTSLSKHRNYEYLMLFSCDNNAMDWQLVFKYELLRLRYPSMDLELIMTFKRQLGGSNLCWGIMFPKLAPCKSSVLQSKKDPHSFSILAKKSQIIRFLL